MTTANPAPTASADEVTEQAVAAHRRGQPATAEQLYRRALALQADHPEANHNLGIILLQQGRLDEGIARFAAAARSDPDRELYRASQARALLIAGRAAEAANVLRQAWSHGLSGAALDALAAQVGIEPTTHSPPARGAGAGAPEPQEKLGCALAASGRFAEAAALFRSLLEGGAPNPDRLLLQLGNSLAEQGELEQAVAAYRRALSIDPELADAHYHLGSILSETGEIAAGFAHLMRRAELVHGSSALPSPAGPEHRAKHDREQRDHLAALGIPASHFHLGDGNRIQGAAVNPASAAPELFSRWRSASPQHVVVENFLTEPALRRLRDYCAQSTVWRRDYDAGYIGATPPDGFACPLLAQIAEETEAIYSEILAGHRFHYLGAFKYDSELSRGTNTHADLSAVNVNLYIAPDTANLDPETGGMILWDVMAADEAEMRRYNGDEAALRAHLSRSGANALRIPHRANRAVIFRSGLFHKTDECRFAEGYLNKRINVSLLFGEFGR